MGVSENGVYPQWWPFIGGNDDKPLDFGGLLLTNPDGWLCQDMSSRVPDNQHEENAKSGDEGGATPDLDDRLVLSR